MKKYNRIFSFVIVTLFLIVFWVIVGFVNFTSQESTTSNKGFLPDEIDLVMTVNSQELIKTFLFDLLFQADLDKNTAQLFTPKETGEIKRSGANLTSEIVVFYDNHKNNSAKGVLLNLNNEGDFKRYPIEGKNIIKKSNTTHGVVILLDDNAPQDIIEHYSNLADKILSKKITPVNNSAQNGSINMSYIGDELTYLNNFDLELNIKNQTIFIEGEGSLNKKSANKIQELNKIVQPSFEKYFEIQTGEIPNEAMEYLTSFIKKMGVQLPKISSQQMLFYGITVENINNSTALLPNFDWILRFNETIQLDSILSNINPNYKPLVDIKNKTIVIESVQYNYSQISEREIYIGISKSPKIESSSFKPSYKASGFPAAILEIDGKGFIVNFIKLLPQVKLSKQFTENITYFAIETEEEGKTLKVIGEISIKEDELMTVEIAKFLLMF